jgi:hypothetical protein
MIRSAVLPIETSKLLDGSVRIDLADRGAVVVKVEHGLVHIEAANHVKDAEEHITIALPKVDCPYVSSDGDCLLIDCKPCYEVKEITVTCKHKQEYELERHKDYIHKKAKDVIEANKKDEEGVKDND